MNKEKNYTLFELCQKNWNIYCPKCGKKVKNIEIYDNASKPDDDDIAQFICDNEDCKFYFKFPWMWHRISASKTVKEIMSKISDLKYEAVWKWANEFKYCNPTYYFTQYKERVNGNKILAHLINGLKGSGVLTNVLAVGSNSNEELKVFEFCDQVDDVLNIVSVDVSKHILEWALQINGGKLVPKNNRKINVMYTEGFIEELQPELYHYKVQKDEQNKLTFGEKQRVEIKNGEFDLCLVLKLFQSSYFNKRKTRLALIGIAEKLKTHGYLIISLAKSTSYLSEDQVIPSDNMDFPLNTLKANFMPGIYNEGEGFRENTSDIFKLYEEVENIGLFDDICIYCGDESSYEYYLTCRKRSRKPLED